MTLLVVIAAILIERFWQGVSALRESDWLLNWTQAFARFLPDVIRRYQWLYIVVILALPFIVVLLLHSMLLNMLGGLPALLFDIFILLLCFGHRPNEPLLDEFIAAQESTDTVAAEALFSRLTGRDMQGVERANSEIIRLVLTQNHRRWFATLFWFLLLGPAGVLVYRLLCQLTEQGEVSEWPMEYLSVVLGFMEWPTARLLALTFFLAGSFDDAWEAWKKSMDVGDKSVNEQNDSVVIDTGCAAISHDVDDEHNDTAYIHAARGIIFRALIMWLACIAVMTLAGWFF